MIDKLTDAQLADLPKWRDMWLEIGLSTAPIDHDRAKEAVRKMYKCAGLNPPNAFIFLDSPHQGAIAAAMLKSTKFGAEVWDQVGDQVRAEVWDQVGDQVRAEVGDQVWDQVGDQVGDQVWAEVGAEVWDQVRAEVGDQVGDQVWDQVGDQVWAEVWDQVGDQVWAEVWGTVYGSHDASWLSFYSFFSAHFGLSEKAAGLFDVARECGWVWPFEGCAIITDRPDVIRMSDDKLLHCEDGPAIRYRDGFSVYAWRGVRVPGNWIEQKESIHPSEILSCENVEQRAAGVAILGMERMLDSLEHRILDSDPDPMHGELIEVSIPDLPEPGRFLKARCPRNGTIFEGVPNDINTVLEAQAWRVGIPASEFIYPTVRT